MRNPQFAEEKFQNRGGEISFLEYINDKLMQTTIPPHIPKKLCRKIVTDARNLSYLLSKAGMKDTDHEIGSLNHIALVFSSSNPGLVISRTEEERRCIVQIAKGLEVTKNGRPPKDLKPFICIPALALYGKFRFGKYNWALVDALVKEKFGIDCGNAYRWWKDNIVGIQFAELDYWRRNAIIWSASAYSNWSKSAKCKEPICYRRTCIRDWDNAPASKCDVRGKILWCGGKPLSKREQEYYNLVLKILPFLKESIIRETKPCGLLEADQV